MHTLSGYLKALMIGFLFSSAIYAQLPDPFDPTYDFEEHLLKPEQAATSHVLSCEIQKDGKFFKKIIYNGSGHVIENDMGKYLYGYKTGDLLSGKISYVDELDLDFKEVATLHYSYNGNGTINLIKKDFENSNSEERIDFVYYDEGPLGLTMFQHYDEESNELTQIKTELFYNSNLELDACKRTKTVYIASSQIFKYAFIEIYRYKNGLLDILETRAQDAEGNNTDITYKYDHDSSNRLSKIQLLKESETRDLESFEYDENGFLKTRTTGNGKYSYHYEFMVPAHVKIEIYDNVAQPRFYEYIRYYENRFLDEAPNTWTFDVYIPGPDFFILEISEDIKLPMFLKPGETTHAVFSGGKFQRVDNDPENNMIGDIENHKKYLYESLEKDEAFNQTKQYIDDMMHKNTSSPIFLYYSVYYDLRYVKNDAFDDFVDIIAGPEDRYKFLREYTQDMIKKYPYNPIAVRTYSYRKNWH